MSSEWQPIVTAGRGLVSISQACGRNLGGCGQWRSWWKRRALAIVLTVGVAFFILLSLGPGIAVTLAVRRAIGGRSRA